MSLQPIDASITDYIPKYTKNSSATHMAAYVKQLLNNLLITHNTNEKTVRQQQQWKRFRRRN